jgi:hypothetical protein
MNSSHDEWFWLLYRGKNTQSFINVTTLFALFACHSREGRNPLWLRRWIPALVYPRAGGAGMTTSLARFSAYIVVTLCSDECH